MCYVEEALTKLSEGIGFSHDDIKNFLVVWVAFSSLLRSGWSSVVGYRALGVHYFPFFFDEQEDGFGGPHFRGSFEVLFKAEDLGVERKLDLESGFIDFDIYSDKLFFGWLIVHVSHLKNYIIHQT